MLKGLLSHHGECIYLVTVVTYHEVRSLSTNRYFDVLSVFTTWGCTPNKIQCNFFYLPYLQEKRFAVPMNSV